MRDNVLMDLAENQCITESTRFMSIMSASNARVELIQTYPNYPGCSYNRLYSVENCEIRLSVQYDVNGFMKCSIFINELEVGEAVEFRSNLCSLLSKFYDYICLNGRL